MGDQRNVETHSVDETRALGAELGAVAAPGDVLLLLGTFGVGKTTLVQGMGLGLGVEGTGNSPSFVIANEYSGRLPLYHVDLYRIEVMDQTTLEALAEYFGGDGLCVVEWPACTATRSHPERGADRARGDRRNEPPNQLARWGFALPRGVRALDRDPGHGARVMGGLILAIDTSSATASVAVYADQVLSETTWHSGRRHSAQLLPAIDDTLSRAGIDKKKLSAIAVAAGPGSYSGLRVGVSTAMSMALALDLALAQVPTLDVIAWAQGGCVISTGHGATREDRSSGRTIRAAIEVGRDHFATAG